MAKKLFLGINANFFDAIAGFDSDGYIYLYEYNTETEQVEVSEYFPRKYSSYKKKLLEIEKQSHPCRMTKIIERMLKSYRSFNDELELPKTGDSKEVLLKKVNTFLRLENARKHDLYFHYSTNGKNGYSDIHATLNFGTSRKRYYC